MACDGSAAVWACPAQMRLQAVIKGLELLHRLLSERVTMQRRQQHHCWPSHRLITVALPRMSPTHLHRFRNVAFLYPRRMFAPCSTAQLLLPMVFGPGIITSARATLVPTFSLTHPSNLHSSLHTITSADGYLLACRHRDGTAAIIH